jgi:hypothetical protein
MCIEAAPVPGLELNKSHEISPSAAPISWPSLTHSSSSLSLLLSMLYNLISSSLTLEHNRLERLSSVIFLG